ncbi:hypothetical protein VTO42DRAFT_534 [Malbranchea cinnamomea]
MFTLCEFDSSSELRPLNHHHNHAGKLCEIIIVVEILVHGPLRVFGKSPLLFVGFAGHHPDIPLLPMNCEVVPTERSGQREDEGCLESKLRYARATVTASLPGVSCWKASRLFPRNCLSIRTEALANSFDRAPARVHRPSSGTVLTCLSGSRIIRAYLISVHQPLPASQSAAPLVALFSHFGFCA